VICLVKVKKSDNGAIEEISDLRKIQEKVGGGSKFIVLPDEFFSVGGLPWKKGDKPRVTLLLKGKPKIVIEGATS